MRFNRKCSLIIVVLTSVPCVPGFAQVASLPPAQEAIVEAPIDAESAESSHAPLVSSSTVEQTIAKLKNDLGQERDEMHQLRAQFQHLKIQLAELREAKIFATPASSRVAPDKLAAIEKVNEKQRQLTAQNIRQNESNSGPPRQSSLANSEHSAGALEAPSEPEKPTLWEQFYTWRGNRIGIQIGEPVTTNPTFPETVSERLKQAKQHLKSYWGSANFEAPEAKTLVTATLSSLIVLPLLFIVVHAINGKWLKT